MTNSSPLIWKRHKKRLYINNCPHCGKELKWIYDGDEWLPCDREPVLFTMHPTGSQTVVYDRKELPYCVIYRKSDPRCQGTPFRGNVQHYYTCSVLKQIRAEYAKNN